METGKNKRMITVIDVRVQKRRPRNKIDFRVDIQ